MPAQQSMPRGRVRISTSTWFGHKFVLPALSPLLELYPHLSVEVDFDDRVVDMVKGGYDIRDSRWTHSRFGVDCSTGMSSQVSVGRVTRVSCPQRYSAEA
ncbi:hypothetical protein IF103_00075 [Pseudomonas sp. SK2]|nr:hypothetical protein IF103_00075 [Pseudomonas sp. SK2]